MISKISLQIFGLVVHCGHWSGVLPYEWDDTKMEIKVSKSILSIVCYLLSLLMVAVTLPMVIFGYVIHLKEFGFHMNDIRNIFRFFYICAGAIMYLFHYQIFMKTTMTVMMFNQIRFFLPRVAEKYSIKSTEGVNLCPVLIGAVLLAGLTAPTFFVLMYLMRCDLHPLYGVVPIVCDQNFPVIYGVLIKFFAGTFIWILGSSLFASGLVAFAPMFFFWFYGLELSRTLMKYEFFKPEKLPEFLCILKCLEILKYRINAYCSPILIPGYFGALMLGYLMSFYAIFKRQVNMLGALS